MDKIKPVAWANKCATGGNLYGIEYGPDGEDTRSYAVEFGDEAVPLYDQSAIDALRAEVDRLHGLLNSAPVVRIGGADGLSCFIEKFGKSSLPSMQGQSVALVSVGAMKDSAP